MIRRVFDTLAPATVALLLAGCVVGPDYQAPEVMPPQAFRGATAAQEGPASFADLPWSDVFLDPVLRDLVAEALVNNQDLKVAVARIQRARAMVDVVRSQSRPQVGYNVRGGVEDTFAPDTDSFGTVTVGSIGAALEAAWEFDVWGRIRRSTEAARANLLAEEEIHRGVMLTLVSDIAAGYFRLLELDREVAIAEDSSRVYGETLDLFTRRFEAGRDSRLPVERTRAAYDSSSAKVEDLRRQIAAQENALAALVGGYPRPIARGLLLDQATAPTLVGQTTELLRRRPDILAAEQRMIEANAEIGVAIANRYPRIGLSALAGGIHANVEGDWDAFGLWGLSLGAAGPILSGGRLEARERERRARLEETVAQYRKTVQTAFRETSDALAAQEALAQRRAALERQVAALRQSASLAMTRYNAGRSAYFEVLEAQQQLFPAEDALAQVQRDQLLAVVGLYRALGGGWREAGAAAQRPGA